MFDGRSKEAAVLNGITSNQEQNVDVPSNHDLHQAFVDYNDNIYWPSTVFKTKTTKN